MKKPKKKTSLANGVNATGTAGGRVPPPLKLAPAPWAKGETWRDIARALGYGSPQHARLDWLRGRA